MFSRRVMNDYVPYNEKDYKKKYETDKDNYWQLGKLGPEIAPEVAQKQAKMQEIKENDRRVNLANRMAIQVSIIITMRNKIMR
jgi:hypothetical protein